MKKNIAILSIIIICCSCSTTSHKFYTDLSIFDYKKIMQDGFFITESNSVNFEYISLGTVVGEISDAPQILRRSGKTEELNESIEDDMTKKYGNIRTNEDMLNAIKDIALKRGGNGIINLKVERIYHPQNGSAYYLSGMIIKSK